MSESIYIRGSRRFGQGILSDRGLANAQCSSTIPSALPETAKPLRLKAYSHLYYVLRTDTQAHKLQWGADLGLVPGSKLFASPMETFGTARAHRAVALKNSLPKYSGDALELPNLAVVDSPIILDPLRQR